jgi:hypothetical protein
MSFERPRDPSTDPERRKTKGSVPRADEKGKYKQCPDCQEWVAMNFCFRCSKSVS